ncbi:MAG: flagellar basal body rod C-terminal domain-containing protein [Desulfobacteraceae bacterium]|jgi:flagellar hook protein FlgE
MIDAISSSLSALSAANKKMGVTSNNIANVNTDKFKKSRVTLSERANGGVSATVDLVDTPGIPKETIQNDQIVQTESSNVDLAEELTELIPTKSLYGANLKTLKTQQDMLGSLIDMVG